MFDRISKRISYRNSPVRRFAALHQRRIAGIAGAVAIGSAALALLRRVRNSGPKVELLSTDGPDNSTRNRSTHDEPTRDELYEMARQHEIPGRSSMTKAELREALEAQ